MVHWLRFHVPNAGAPGSIPGQETRSRMPQLKISCAATKTWHSQINKHLFKSWASARPRKNLLGLGTAHSWAECSVITLTKAAGSFWTRWREREKEAKLLAFRIFFRKVASRRKMWVKAPPPDPKQATHSLSMERGNVRTRGYEHLRSGSSFLKKHQVWRRNIFLPASMKWHLIVFSSISRLWLGLNKFLWIYWPLKLSFLGIASSYSCAFSHGAICLYLIGL